MNLVRRVAVALALTSVCGFAQSSYSGSVLGAPDGNTTPASAEARKSDEAVYRQHILTLSNPYFEGRCPGTRGNADAAEYLQFHMSRAGLTPAFSTGEGPTLKRESSFFQPFTPGRLREGTMSVEVQKASAAMSGGAREFTAEADFRALGLSGNGTATGELVCVGYGIKEGRDGYTNLPSGTSLKGKVALVFRFEPMNDEGKSQWASSGWSPRAGLPDKLAAVAQAGAAGIILVHPPGAKDPRVGRLATLSETKGDGPMGIPVVMMTEDAVDALCKAGDAQGRSLADLTKAFNTKGDPIELTKASVTLEVKTTREKVTTNNVGGILKGKGALADQFVVIGAHYDHVGYGEFGSLAGATGTIHPGADDNASGTSGMLLLTRKLADYYAKLPADASVRSVLFLGFSAEESGLEGSAFYCKPENMIVPKDRHYFMMNLDMIGRLRDAPPLEVTGVGSAGGLAEWLKPYFDNAGFKIVTKARAPGNSDHASFFRAGIPIAFFFTGLHGEYHRPADTADLINVEGATQIVDLVYRIAIDATSRTQPLPFGEKSEAEKPKPTEVKPDEVKPVEGKPAEAKADEANRPAPGGAGVRFGVQPGDYADDKPGLLVGEVYPGTPAAEAGLKKGDRIVKWNDTAIKDAETFTTQLRAGKPGDKVTIGYVREGVSGEQSTVVTLVARQTSPGG